MKFEEIAQDIQSRKADEGIIIGNLQSKRLAAIEIVEGFRTVGEARESIGSLQETGNCLFMAVGHEVDWECLEWAVGMFLPSQIKDQEMQRTIYEWYKEQ